MRTLLAVLAAVLCALLRVPAALAADVDGGVPARPPAVAAPAAAGGDGGTSAGSMSADAGVGAGAGTAPGARAGTGADAGRNATPGAHPDGGTNGEGGPADTEPSAAQAAAAAASGPVIRLPPTLAEQSEGLPIASIEIVGNRRVGREDVLSYLREKPGHLFKVDNLTGDVHALWDSGFFEDIRVDLTTNDRGVVLRFLVVEKPNIKEVVYAGNDELDNDKLNEAVEV
jgi:outer membrane protein insertion porin family